MNGGHRERIPSGKARATPVSTSPFNPTFLSAGLDGLSHAGTGLLLMALPLGVVLAATVLGQTYAGPRRHEGEYGEIATKWGSLERVPPSILRRSEKLNGRDHLVRSLVGQPTDRRARSASTPVIWDNYPFGDSGWVNSSQLDPVYPFNSQVADDFEFAIGTKITDVHWRGRYWNQDPVAPNTMSFHILFYADNGTGNAPNGAGSPDPSGTALAHYNIPIGSVAVTPNGSILDGYDYEVDLPSIPGYPDGFVAAAGVKYWIAIQSENIFPPQWGIMSSLDQQLHVAVSGFPLLETDYWTNLDNDGVNPDMCFRLTGFEAPQREVSWSTVDGGGVMFATGGGYEVGGTIGQPDAGTLRGGGYVVTGGFWSLGPACTMADPLTKPTGEAGYEKVRYISMVPGNPGRLTALRVTLSILAPPFAGLNGTQCWVDEPRSVSENAGKVDHEPGWPDFMSANLDGTPYCMDWSMVGVLHVTDDDIIPSAVYDVQAIDCECDFSNEDNYSIPLTITTSIWGDLVRNCAVYPCGPPDGTVGIPTDVSACVDKFRNLPNAVIKARADVEPNLPDWLVNISDCTNVIDAFRGFAYPPAQTPPAPGWPGPDTCP